MFFKQWSQSNFLLIFQLILSELGLVALPEAILNLYHGLRISHLDLSYNKLRSVEGISFFKHLESLVLDNNQLTMIGGGFDEFSRPVRLINPNLKVLSVNNNRIMNLDAFLRNISICFPNLTYLSLLRNPCCPDDNFANWNIIGPYLSNDQYAAFKAKCARALPRLQFLDSTSLKLSKCSSSSSPFPFELPSRQEIVANLVKFKNGLVEVFTDDGSAGIEQSPLPNSQRSPGDHHGMYGRNRVEYIGKQSEGNRFIGNGQL